VLRIDYPSEHPIARLTRTLRGVPGASRLDTRLDILPRRDVTLPIGLHPVFRLPESSGQARLAFDGAVRVHTYPVDAEEGVSRFAWGSASRDFRACLTRTETGSMRPVIRWRSSPRRLRWRAARQVSRISTILLNDIG